MDGVEGRLYLKKICFVVGKIVFCFDYRNGAYRSSASLTHPHNLESAQTKDVAAAFQSAAQAVR